MRRLPSYFGITDFTYVEQVDRMLKVFSPTRSLTRAEAQRKLMVGVMMSRKTLDGLPTKWAEAFPAKEQLLGIFMDYRSVLNTLHYADFEEVDLVEHLFRAVGWCGPNLHAVQLDMVWPDHRAIATFAERRPDLFIILQINRKSFEGIEHRPDLLMRELGNYGRIHGVLLDCSMGEGRALDPDFLAPFIAAVTSERPDLMIGVAGGLGPDSLHLVADLLQRFPRLSLDAQGQLRASGNSMDPMDWDRAEKYLQGAFELLPKE